MLALIKCVPSRSDIAQHVFFVTMNFFATFVDNVNIFRRLHARYGSQSAIICLPDNGCNCHESPPFSDTCTVIFTFPKTHIA